VPQELPDPLFDPAVDRTTDPAALQALVHPLRLQLLGQLRRHGPATATQLAAALHVSSALASYHLRQLDAGGFVEDADDDEVAERRRGGRERWWRASARSTWVTSTSTTDSAADAIVRDYLAVVLENGFTNARTWLDVEPEWPDEWQHLDDFSDVMLALTPAEVRQFDHELAALRARYRRHDPAEPLPPGAAIVTFQYQLYPEPRQAPPESPRSDG
jgi:DNA-binding transcriptional ArsR family regulator